MDRALDFCMTALNATGRAFCEHGAAMLVQSTVLIVSLLVLDQFLRKRVRAALRYWIWMLVFVKLLLPPALSLPTGIGYWWGDRVSTITPTFDRASSGPAPHTEVNVPTPEYIAAPIEARPADLSPANLGSTATIAPETESPTPLTWQAAVLLLWLVGVLVFVALMAQRVSFVRALVGQSKPAAGPLRAALDPCRAQIGVEREIELRVSPDALSPAVCGLWQPTILMPANLLEKLSPEAVEAVLIHELAHIKRRDLWVNSVQTVLQIAYFYNPFLWLANAVVRGVREQAVDEMVLVALGAKAKSYSRTLIDVAQMAFFRASLGLRLVGVAESKRSLERRIRHMIARPIPRTAKLGLIGSLIVVAIGIVLLPMAAASNRAGGKGGGYPTAILPNGVEVHLVALCDWPDTGRRCWKPDGSKPDVELYVERGDVKTRDELYGCVLKATGPADLEVAWRQVEGARTRSGMCKVINEGGTQQKEFTAALLGIDRSRSRTSVKIGIATGPWNTVAGHDGQGRKAEDGVLWSQVFQTANGVHIVASVPWRKDQAERIVALDKDGRLHAAPGLGSVASGDIDQFTATFTRLAAEDISEFLFQTRDYDWVEFRNVSLRPGERTDVQVQTAPSSRAKGVRSLPDGPDFEANAVSGTRLMDLDKALRIYADDHDDRFPDRMADAVACYPINLPWLQQHVVYLGKGKAMSVPPDAVLAYDRTMLAEGIGTLVLFAASHVDFRSREELEALGIKAEAARDIGSKAQAVSRAQLMDLGKALLIYANDHDDKFPEHLSDLRDEVGVGIFWLLENVTYLGKDMSPRDRPARVLAYDRTLLEKGQGTNVLYLDSHVAFETPEELEKLGIKPVPNLAAAPQEETADQARKTALDYLRQLALAAHMFADDHSGILVANPAALEPYLAPDKELRRWMYRNVEFVAEDGKLTGGAEGSKKPLAYWKSPPAAMDGTAVAFQDGHAEFVASSRLEELGIRIEPQKDR